MNAAAARGLIALLSALLSALLAASLALASGTAGAYEIYKWVDENGVVHYGDARPESAASTVETLHVPETNPPGYDASAASRAVVAHAQRIREDLAAEREAQEAAAARERALAAEARIAELEQRVAAAEDAAYAARGIYAPFGLLHRPHRLFPPLRHRLPHRLPPPHRPADGPRPGWPGPVEPAAPVTPGFSSPDR